MEKNNLRKLKRLRLTLNQTVAMDRAEKVFTAAFRERLDTYAAARRRTDNDAAVEVQAFIEVGQMLIDIKGKLRHGRWLAWVATNLKRDVSTAQRWMRAAQWASANTASVPHLVSVASLLRLCAEERRELVTVVQPFTLSLAIAHRWLAGSTRLTLAIVATMPEAERPALALEVDAQLTHLSQIRAILPAPMPSH